MPVEVAATRGERFAKDGTPSPDYREARTTITLGKGEARDSVIPCPFEPDRIIVDPDAKVLQLSAKCDGEVLRFVLCPLSFVLCPSGKNPRWRLSGIHGSLSVARCRLQKTSASQASLVQGARLFG